MSNAYSTIGEVRRPGEMRDMEAIKSIEKAKQATDVRYLGAEVLDDDEGQPMVRMEVVERFERLCHWLTADQAEELAGVLMEAVEEIRAKGGF